MVTRQLIHIDEALCDGCGECVTACAEGALAVVNGKARLVREDYCDGLGVCLGECPRGAISLEETETLPFDVEGASRHSERQHRAGLPTATVACAAPARSCPGSAERVIATREPSVGREATSALGHWPVQLHLIAPSSPVYRDCDLLVAADCSAFAAGDFHARFLRGRSVVIACPKLDQGLHVYERKLEELLGAGGARSVTVVVMEVPCCAGLVRLVTQAATRAAWSGPLHVAVVGVDGVVKSSTEAPFEHGAAIAAG